MSDLHQIIASLARLEKICTQNLAHARILNQTREQLFADLAQAISPQPKQQPKSTPPPKTSEPTGATSKVPLGRNRLGLAKLFSELICQDCALDEQPGVSIIRNAAELNAVFDEIKGESKHNKLRRAMHAELREKVKEYPAHGSIRKPKFALNVELDDLSAENISQSAINILKSCEEAIASDDLASNTLKFWEKFNQEADKDAQSSDPPPTKSNSSTGESKHSILPEMKNFMQKFLSSLDCNKEEICDAVNIMTELFTNPKAQNNESTN